MPKSSRPRKTKNTRTRFSCHLYTHWENLKDGYCIASVVAVSGTFSNDKDNSKSLHQVLTIDANARNFEAELQAQEESNTRMETNLHAEATVLTASAL